MPDAAQRERRASQLIADLKTAPVTGGFYRLPVA